ncbi:HpcH/HpaI aldolase [Mycolicibacterium vanbaalenii PYR-1]|uniref:HpcH/HpaI aldolase n=1 Tax=Mycolicibacterium vanbaalenii (strain DSM 7251 / JCM 13017 / BCRC 16820 / KCTC 9966 / NRRL B-24157 / PYR-1) TaxID=350058 RepID=A1THX3_MYCVP|nr:HpcH/HpaI aldolase [Mycolicibacterium vanbaalenii PYR-1]
MRKPAADTLRVSNTVLDVLKRGDVATALSIRLVRTPEIVLLARSAGFDAVFVDLEHSTITDDATSQINMTALAAGITPLIHVRSAYAETIGAGLDGGALGIIVPHVDSVEDAEAAVKAARYAPRGERGISSALPFFDFRAVQPEAATAAVDAATLVIAMVESQTALDRIDEIAAVDGVDVLLVGANDLTADIGVPGHHGSPEAWAAYRRVIGAAEAAGKFAGIGGVPIEGGVLREVIQAGMRFVSAGPEIRHLGRAVTAWNHEVRSAM